MVSKKNFQIMKYSKYTLFKFFFFLNFYYTFSFQITTKPNGLRDPNIMERILWVCLDTAYFTETENLLLKVL